MNPSPSPERSVYGFVLYLSTYIAFILYVVWAYIPEEWLHAIGLTYWPQKYWALVLPLYIVILAPLLYVVYISMMLINTAPLSSVDTITDPYSRKKDSKPLADDAVPPVSDLSLSEVNKLLYGNH